MVKEIIGKNKLQLMEDLTLWEESGRITMSRKAKIQLIDFILFRGVWLYNDLIGDLIARQAKTGDSLESVVSEQLKEINELIIELENMLEGEVRK